MNGVTLILDGLDEYRRAYADDNITNFLRKLKSASMGTGSRLVILSCNEAEIRVALALSSPIPGHRLYPIKIDDETTQSDTCRYAASFIDSRYPKMPEEDREEIVRCLVNGCGGMFL